MGVPCSDRSHAAESESLATEVEMDGKDANPQLKRKNTEEASKPEGKGGGQDEMSLRTFRGVSLAADLSGALASRSCPDCHQVKDKKKNQSSKAGCHTEGDKVCVAGGGWTFAIA